MRIATWNVNSLKARMEAVEKWLARAEPDVLLMQETKLADADAPVMPFRMLGYELVHHGEGRWNGVAILTRVGAEDVITNFGDGPVRDSSAGSAAARARRTSTRSTRPGWCPPSAAASASSACTPRTAGSWTRRSTSASCAGSSASPAGWPRPQARTSRCCSAATTT